MLLMFEFMLPFMLPLILELRLMLEFIEFEFIMLEFIEFEFIMFEFIEFMLLVLSAAVHPAQRLATVSKARRAKVRRIDFLLYPRGVRLLGSFYGICPARANAFP